MIFLQILKVVGLVLLVLLAIVLLLVLLLLLIPIRYQVRGAYDDNFSIKGNVSWLLHLIAYTFKIENEKQKHCLRILFFHKTFRDDFSTKEKKHSTKNNHPGELRDREKNIATMKDKTATEAKQEPLFLEESNFVDSSLSDEENESPVDNSNKKRKFHQINFTRRIKDLWNKIVHFICNIQSHLKKFYEIYQNIQYRNAFLFLKNQAFILLKRICPKRMKVSASFSTGAPDTTGQVLGILALFPFVYRNRWEIHPDFESDKFYVNAKFNIKGHFYNVCIVAIVIRILFNQDCRKVYHDFRK